LPPRPEQPFPFLHPSLSLSFSFSLTYSFFLSSFLPSFLSHTVLDSTPIVCVPV
jgi:hypothetical protein